MKHPLINPSLTPHGVGVGNTYRRTTWKSDDRGRCNGDWCAAQCWQEANRLSCTNRPTERIVHEIMPGMRKIGHTTDGDIFFDGKPYRSDDVLLLTTIATWLGTNCGTAMCNNPLSMQGVRVTKTTEFQVKWKVYERHRSPGYLLRHLLHECRRGVCGHEGTHSCASLHRSAAEREELVLQAFLFWLGTTHGREYMAGMRSFIRTTSRNVWQGYLQRLAKQQLSNAS